MNKPILKVRGKAHLVARFDDVVHELDHLVALFDRLVFRIVADVQVLEFGPAADFDVSVRRGVKEARVSAGRAGLPNGKGSLMAAFYQTGPVLDGAGHVAAVDKAEQRSNRPVGFGIVDFEGDILGEP